ncbi:Rec8 like protein-domain-containing protein [Spinellus fusiger]|nr:Rec8 like protein-domain-containing protein [Spinellus fusiger]
MSILPDQVIAKQGPLARVWIASHWERKLSKSQFLQTNLEKTIGNYKKPTQLQLDAITTNQQQEPYALRVSGQLLLGVVRIYSRKTRYLLEDCNEALVKIKLAFKKGDVNMPDVHQSVANLGAITLPERLTEFDLLLPSISFNALPAYHETVLDGTNDITLANAQEGLNNSWAFDSMEQSRLQQVDGLDFELTMGGDTEAGRRDAGLMEEISFQLDEPMNKMRLEDMPANDDFFDIDFDVEDNEPRMLDDTFLQPDTMLRQDILGMEEEPFLGALTQTQVQEPVRRRHRLVVDKITEIPHETLKSLMHNTSSIVDKSPPSYSMPKPVVNTAMLRPLHTDRLHALNLFKSPLGRNSNADRLIDNDYYIPGSNESSQYGGEAEGMGIDIDYASADEAITGDRLEEGSQTSSTQAQENTR